MGKSLDEFENPWKLSTKSSMKSRARFPMFDDATSRNFCHQTSIMTGWWFGTFFIFPYIGLLIIPIDELIFFRGVALAHQPDDDRLTIVRLTMLTFPSPTSGWTSPWTSCHGTQRKIRRRRCGQDADWDWGNVGTNRVLGDLQMSKVDSPNRVFHNPSPPPI